MIVPSCNVAIQMNCKSCTNPLDVPVPKIRPSGWNSAQVNAIVKKKFYHFN